VTDKQNHQANLINAVNLYNSLGYSVIPIRSDKRAFTSWKPAQTRKSSPESVANILKTKPSATGIAIVTGTVSKLAVLDFDDIAYYDLFSKRYPELTHTHTVKTRRGYHLYYRVHASQKTQTRKCEGMDWLYNGAYVVAPPSIIGDVQYEIAYATTPRTLSNKDLANIHRFLNDYTHQSSTHEQGRANITLTVEQVQSRYQQERAGGRNNALFYTAVMARNAGWSRHQAVQALIELFVNDNPNGELPERRLKEGLATITSAFSRPQNRRHAKHMPRGLLNPIREALLANGMTHMIRTLDALHRLNVRPGDSFTENALKQKLKGIVGNHSLRRTLTHSFYRGTPKGVADSSIPSCDGITLAKPKLNKRGRPTLIYTMPSNEQLAEFLGIDLIQISDPLSLEDLSSVKRTREAMHREFIRRRPGVYASAWLAQRLSVSIATKNRYDQAIGVHKTPTYRDIPISLGTCGHLPEGETRGIFLQDNHNKRYPVIIRLAKALLLKGLQLVLRKQHYNHYSMSAPKTPDVIDFTPKEVNAIQATKIQIRAKFGTDMRVYEASLPITSDETLAEHIHTTLDQPTFSLSSARRLVSLYGSRTVETAFNQLQHKRHVKNPAGLLTFLVKSI
jgi:hypothetical protein